MIYSINPRLKILFYLDLIRLLFYKFDDFYKKCIFLQKTHFKNGFGMVLFCRNAYNERFYLKGILYQL